MPAASETTLAPRTLQLRPGRAQECLPTQRTRWQGQSSPTTRTRGAPGAADSPPTSGALRNKQTCPWNAKAPSNEHREVRLTQAQQAKHQRAHLQRRPLSPPPSAMK